MTSATLDSELTDPFYLEYDKGVLDDILNSPTPDSAAAFEGLGVYLAN